MCYNIPVHNLNFTADAVRQFRRLPRAVKSLIKDAIRIHLIEADATETTRNKFRLRRPSEHADYELRAGDWRIFYRVQPDMILITLLGKKKGSRLLVEGEEILL